MKTRVISLAFVFFLFPMGPLISGESGRSEPLEGTRRLEMEGDLASELVAGVDRFLLRQIEQSVAGRARRWKRNFESAAKYDESVTPNRRRLARIIGAHDERVEIESLQLVGTTGESALVGEGKGFEVIAVRWPSVRGVEWE